MKKIVAPFLILLASCAQHNADRKGIDFEPMYPQEMPLVETSNRSGTIFNSAQGNLFSMESTAQMVGDIITVQFAESFQATKSQNAATSRSLDGSVTLPGVMDLILPSGTNAANASADLTAQANHIGVTIQADIIKQKLPTNNGGYNAVGFGKTHPKVYSELTTDHPIDLTRYQVANCYMGRIGLINSGGASVGDSDLQDAVVTAVVNKRAGGQGLIMGRKAFQKPVKEGIELIQTVQDIYLNEGITLA